MIQFFHIKKFNHEEKNIQDINTNSLFVPKRLGMNH